MSTVRSEPQYVYGNAVPQREPYSPAPQPQPRRNPERNTPPRAKPSPLFRMLGNVMLVGLVFGVLAGVLWGHSMVSKAQIEVHNMKNTITSIERENSLLTEEKNLAMDIAVIQEKARGMGMDYPRQNQVRNIDLGE